MLYATSGLILVRSIFRVVEYLQGHDGYLVKSEAWMYVFDALLMFAAAALFNVVHPSQAVPGRRGRPLSVASKETMDMELIEGRA